MNWSLHIFGYSCPTHLCYLWTFSIGTSLSEVSLCFASSDKIPFHRKAAEAEPRRFRRDPNRRLPMDPWAFAEQLDAAFCGSNNNNNKKKKKKNTAGLFFFRIQFLFQCSFFEVKTNLKHHQDLVQDYHLAQPIISLIQNLQTYCKAFTNPDPARIKFWRRKSLSLSQWTLKKKIELYFPY